MAFDMTVDHRDPKTGRIVKHTPYAAHISNEGVVFERDGVYYLEDGKEAPEEVVLSIVGPNAYGRPGIKKATPEAKK